MKKLLIVLICGLLLIGCGTNKQEQPDEIKGIWISYIELSQLLDRADEATFRSRMEEVYSNVKELGLNTVYVHASAFTDSFYQSSYYPFSHHASGEVGKELEYDPYQIMIELAHQNGLRFEAWINPMRSYKAATLEELDQKYILATWYQDSNKKDLYLVEVDDRYYLNPAYQEVRELVCLIVEEILNNYEVDGIHMDDYFYPEKLDESFDASAYAQYGNGRSLTAFRKENVNTLVKELYQTVKNYDKSITFSISPAGNIQYNLETIYADVETWLKEPGYLDYVVPQIYWGFEHKSAAFDKRVEEWNALIQQDSIQLVVGLGAYRINQEDAGEEWKQEDLLARQVEYAKNMSHYGGIVIYSYQSLFWANEKDKPLVERQIEYLKEIMKENN